MKYTKIKMRLIEGNLVQVMKDNTIKKGNPYYYMRNGKIKTPCNLWAKKDYSKKELKKKVKKFYYSL